MTSSTRTRSALGALTMAAAMAVTLVAPMPAFAQGTATTTTTEESSESQMDMSLEQFFESHGIKTEVQKLTMGQMAAIQGIISSSDSSGQQKVRIEAIIANN